MKELHLTKKDFKLDWFSGTGPGGQHKNKHRNSVRITHLATGITTVGQNHRERSRNQDEAFRRLAQILIAKLCVDDVEFDISDERIRTYHASRNVVHDHASGEKRTYKEVVTAGNLGELIESRRRTKGAE